MSIASRFQARLEEGPVAHITVDGQTVRTTDGISLAAALLAHSGSPTRQTENGAERMAFCMMGVCFDCLVEVDGQPNTQACMILVRDGMVVTRQIGRRGLKGDFGVKV